MSRFKMLAGRNVAGNSPYVSFKMSILVPQRHVTPPPTPPPPDMLGFPFVNETKANTDIEVSTVDDVCSVSFSCLSR